MQLLSSLQVPRGRQTNQLNRDVFIDVPGEWTLLVGILYQVKEKTALERPWSISQNTKRRLALLSNSGSSSVPSTCSRCPAS